MTKGKLIDIKLALQLRQLKERMHRIEGLLTELKTNGRVSKETLDLIRQGRERDAILLDHIQNRKDIE